VLEERPADFTRKMKLSDGTADRCFAQFYCQPEEQLPFLSALQGRNCCHRAALLGAVVTEKNSIGYFVVSYWERSIG